MELEAQGDILTLTSAKRTDISALKAANTLFDHVMRFNRRMGVTTEKARMAALDVVRQKTGINLEKELGAS